jgi:hypothetical protein
VPPLELCYVLGVIHILSVDQKTCFQSHSILQELIELQHVLLYLILSVFLILSYKGLLNDA